jgi:hypothetical protein
VRDALAKKLVSYAQNVWGSQWAAMDDHRAVNLGKCPLTERQTIELLVVRRLCARASRTIWHAFIEVHGWLSGGLAWYTHSARHSHPTATVVLPRRLPLSRPSRRRSDSRPTPLSTSPAASRTRCSSIPTRRSIPRVRSSLTRSFPRCCPAPLMQRRKTVACVCAPERKRRSDLGISIRGTSERRQEARRTPHCLSRGLLVAWSHLA